MAKQIIMPKQGQSVESCIITKWFKKKGDTVAAGDLLFAYETDKASFEEESKESGILLDCFYEVGDDVPCLTPVCVIGEEGEDISGLSPCRDSADKPAERQASEKENEERAFLCEDKKDAPLGHEAGKIKISPRAKRLSESSFVDFRHAVGTGPDGRIIERDVIRLKASGPAFTYAARDMRNSGDMAGLPEGTGLGGRITASDLLQAEAGNSACSPAGRNEAFEREASQPAAAAYEEVKLTNIRRVIAKTMQASLSTAAQLTLHTSFDATEILELRKRLKAKSEGLGLEDITLNDMILFAVSRTLIGHAALNAHYLDEKMLLFKQVNLGVAVDTDRGLMVPTIFNADKKSLNEISREVKNLAKECQAGTINPDLLKNGSFTVTNLGAMGIESFTPVINPPQTGILGVNNIIRRAREVNGQIEYYPAMGLSLTFDHRALDGAPAARFLKDLAKRLESFTVLLAK